MARAAKAQPGAAEGLGSIFPFYLELDRELRLVQAGRGLPLVCPDLVPGHPLLDSFAPEGFPAEVTYETLAAAPGTPIALRSRTTALVLHGQVIVSQKRDRLFFLGSPWLGDADVVAALGLNAAHYALSPTSQRASVDAPVPDRLAELHALGGPQLVDEILAEFQIQIESDLHDIDQAAQASDFQELLRLAHRLKGAATTVGMTAIVSLCNELEIAARGQNRRRIQGVIERLRREAEAHSPDPSSKVGDARQTRILIADDHPVVRFGVRRMLQGHPEFLVVGDAANGKEAIQQMRELHPDILLLDLNMPLLPGLETLRELTTSQIPTKTVLLTSTITQRQVLEALQLGARGVVLKDAMASDLADCIAAVTTGHYWLGSKPVSNLVQVLHDLMEEIRQPPQNTFGLTARELEVVTLIAQGMTNKDIARECRIAEETVKRHLKNIFDKVGVWNRLELALFAINNHLVGDIGTSA
jgi:DNA-binding NarL/FixJ family response regulator